MKTTPQKSSPVAPTGYLIAAFTLIELLVVIAIIAILASMLLPVIAIAQKHARVTEAKTQIADLANGIQEYESDYSRFPVSPEVQAAGFQEITYGGLFAQPNGNPLLPVGSTNSTTGFVYTNNSDVIAILLDYTNYPNGYNATVPGVGGWTVNTNYQKNPKQNIYLPNVKPSNWDPTKGGQPVPGIGDDLVYRDPWGHPYVITMDLDEDNFTSDAFYGLPAVSSSTQNPGAAGLVGLSYHVENSMGSYTFKGNVMVWSAGPDGQIDSTNFATQGVNKDNVLSWQQ